MNLHLTKIIAVFWMLCLTVNSISIPLTQNANRCMIVYTSTSDQNLILDMKFPPIPNFVKGEAYRITIINTQDKSQIQQTIQSGKYRKQMDLVQSVVYKICFAILTNRAFGSVVVQYNAQTKFHQQIQTVKVPQSLLKADDFKNTYLYAQRMFDMTSTSIQHQKDRKGRQDFIYLQNKKNMEYLFWISLTQISVILITGLYQFFTVRSFLISKQYL